MTVSLTTMLASIALALHHPSPSPEPPGWLRLPLSDGAELRYLPLVVTLKDYPKKARKAGDEGTSLLNLEIDPTGHVIGCTTARSSGSPILDEEACKLYRKRGRFKLRGVSGPKIIPAPVRWVLVD